MRLLLVGREGQSPDRCAKPPPGRMISFSNPSDVRMRICYDPER